MIKISGLAGLLAILTIPFLIDPSPALSAPQERNLKKIEQIIFRLTNEERAKRGLPPFVQNDSLETTARRHSQAMADKNFFSHMDPEKRTPDTRFHEWFPAILGGVGENIAFIQSSISDEDMAAQFVQNWMNSPAHKRNILSPQFFQMGVGAGIRKSDGSVYGTQNFGDLQAEFVSMKPEKARYGGKLEMIFKKLTPVVSSRISIFVQFPDPKAKFVLPDGSYYTGIAPMDPVWMDAGATTFKISFDLDKGKGDYRILMGLDGGYYMPGYVISIQ